MLSSLIVAGCSEAHDSPVSKQLNIVVDAGFQLRQELSSVEVHVQKQGSSGTRTLSQVRFEVGSAAAWPLTIEILVDDGLAGTYRLTATGRDPQSALVAQKEVAATIADDSDTDELHIRFEDPEGIDAAVSDVEPVPECVDAARITRIAMET
jgi:Tfp pilus assembly protein PilX